MCPSTRCLTQIWTDTTKKGSTDWYNYHMPFENSPRRRPPKFVDLAIFGEKDCVQPLLVMRVTTNQHGNGENCFQELTNDLPTPDRDTPAWYIATLK